MATLCAKLGAAVCFAGMMGLASAAHACDERFPWTCKPAPSTASAEPAESAKPSAKPLQIAARRRGSNAKTAKASERSAHVSRKRLARKAATQRWVARARHAKAVAAVREGDTRASEETRATPGDAFNKAVPEAQELGRKDAPPRSSRSTRVADGSSEGGPGFASMWKDRMVAAAEPVEMPPPRQPAAAAAAAADPASAPAQRPLPAISQDEVNDMDLAAAAAPATTDSFWLRGLFLALGGLLAVGSALRFLV
jgi:hypothetical protein